MMVSAMLVLFMTPGLAFFYGGLSRRKNVVNTMLMSFAVIGIVGLTWVIAGWSIAYGGDGSNPVIGGLIYTGDASLLVSQLLGIAVTVVVVRVIDVLLIAVIRAIFGGRLRVTDSEEALGLDVAAHGESAYPAYTGLDI